MPGWSAPRLTSRSATTLWAKHIAEAALRRCVIALPAGTPLLRIDGRPIGFKKMKDGRDVRPTPGLRVDPDDAEGRTNWAELQTRRGEVVSIKVDETPAVDPTSPISMNSSGNGKRPRTRPLSMIYEQRYVARARFPFADAMRDKLRSVLVLSTSDYNRSHELAIVVMITSALQGPWSTDHEIIDTVEAGLHRACVVRYKISTLAPTFMNRRLGSFSGTDRRAVSAHLATILPTGTHSRP